MAAAVFAATRFAARFVATAAGAVKATCAGVFLLLLLLLPLLLFFSPPFPRARGDCHRAVVQQQVLWTEKDIPNQLKHTGYTRMRVGGMGLHA